jgi:hypothetical protein
MTIAAINMWPTRSRQRYPSTPAFKHPKQREGHRYWQIVLQKSPNRLCEIEICNDRIGARAFLNHCCAFAPDLESMLRDKMLKILLQQYRPQADIGFLGFPTQNKGPP